MDVKKNLSGQNNIVAFDIDATDMFNGTNINYTGMLAGGNATVGSLQSSTCSASTFSSNGFFFDYQEGTWDLAFEQEGTSIDPSGEYNTFYCKIGRMCLLTFKAQFKTTGSPSGPLRMNLPFKCFSNNDTTPLSNETEIWLGGSGPATPLFTRTLAGSPIAQFFSGPDPPNTFVSTVDGTETLLVGTLTYTTL